MLLDVPALSLKAQFATIRVRVMARSVTLTSFPKFAQTKTATILVSLRRIISMKIAKIEQFFPLPRIRLVKVTTDNDLVGWGETTLEGKPKSVHGAVEELAEYLIGKDPLRI